MVHATRDAEGLLLGGAPPALSPTPITSLPSITVSRCDVSESRTPRSAAGTLSLMNALRGPGSGILRQGFRFALAGGTVALVYLTVTTLLAKVAGLPFQAALAIGFCIAIAVHFTLQRVFVWTHHEEFALPLHWQAGRYLAAAAVQYGVTAASIALLPSALGVSTELVYLATAAVVMSANFLVFRHGIFHAKPAAQGWDEEAPAFGGDPPAPSSLEQPTR